ncbi:bi-domain-containing oxidoreductase [Rubellicoccus peritrichatus]|uniref:Bi-domain-containing oxidoreductase n=1 Tax=Rubellicoccus peritrichatus TaxID=3080537 RepID=A0AAQ3LCH5_9BACT|nr:bi-domain-containing oxidoreductase [Puniceicoccus sp. CR14]WOO42926.1 bi-domain-containing oxidoreductase [Puniceicoccus sp. CR14]
MKQILQNLSSGETLLADVPAPKVRAGHLLIETRASLVSLGTERMLIDFGKANLLDKARQQPEKVKQVLQKIKTDGLMPTIEVVRSKLDAPLPLGYCNVGKIIEVGEGVEGFRVGDQVLSNSSHAEIVCAPKNLCAKLPVGVGPEAAVFGVVGSIALQGIRLLEPTLGETFVVTGLGLIGQLAVQILIASGCRVIGVDFDSEKCRLAEQFGAMPLDLSTGVDPVKAVEAMMNGEGVDGVLITASTKSDEPIHQAAHMCRKRGRIVLVGVVGMKMNRSDFYEKELSFQVSCAYGPGRYDPFYEEKGNDYPQAYVRWTEQRNFKAILGLMESGKLVTDSLVTHRFSFEKAIDAYSHVGKGAVMGIVLNYNTDTGLADAEGDLSGKIVRNVTISKVKACSDKPLQAKVGVIGAGNFTSLVILPALKKTGAQLKSISSGTGVSASHLASKFGFESALTDNDEIFEDPDIDTVFITTRHANHGSLVLRALRAGKHVFVEKPLCIQRSELEEIRSEIVKLSEDQSSKCPLLMVGFNRRFAPLIRKMKSLATNRTDPLSMIFHVNAGPVPRDHWSQLRDEGGGRILGEACHFIDTLRYLTDSKIEKVTSVFARKNKVPIDDVVSINLEFEDGSIGTVHYFANGNKAYSREHLDLYCGEKILRMENFRKLTGYRWPGFRKLKLRRQDKGHATEIAEFISAIETGRSAPIDKEEIFGVTEASFIADAQAFDY